MEAINLLKNIGGVLATITSIIYAAGYMVLRSRSNALGTDLSFKLLDETYIFAGFRFALVTIITLLLLSPIILFVKWLTVWAFNKISTDLANIIEWIVLVILVFVAISFLRIFNVNGLLIQNQNSSYSDMQQAVLGGQPLLRLSITFLTTFIAAITFLWLRGKYLKYGFNEFTLILSITFFVQICVLPAFHGALFADHRVRVLSEVPSLLKGIRPPVCIVDRNSDCASLFGLNEDSQPCLVTVKTDDVNSIPVKRITNLFEFVENDIFQGKKTTPVILDTIKKSEIMKPKVEHQESKQNTPKENSQKSFFASIVSFLNITFEAVGSLSDGSGEAGQLWIAQLDSSGTVTSSKQIGSFDDLSWPVIGPDKSDIYAIQGENLIRIGMDGRVIDILSSDHKWLKLLGVVQENSILGIVREGNESYPAIFIINKKQFMVEISLSDDEEANKSILLQETRTYTGGGKLYVERSERGGRGFDVYYKVNDKVVNISDCGDDSSRQPSLSPDYGIILFIKKLRY